MRVNKQMTLDVQEAYRVITGKHVNAWAIRTRAYVSVKLQGRHLSTSEAARFAETMRNTRRLTFLNLVEAVEKGSRYVNAQSKIEFCARLEILDDE